MLRQCKEDYWLASSRLRFSSAVSQLSRFAQCSYSSFECKRTLPAMGFRHSMLLPWKIWILSPAEKWKQAIGSDIRTPLLIYRQETEKKSDACEGKNTFAGGEPEEEEQKSRRARRKEKRKGKKGNNWISMTPQSPRPAVGVRCVHGGCLVQGSLGDLRRRDIERIFSLMLRPHCKSQWKSW